MEWDLPLGLANGQAAAALLKEQPEKFAQALILIVARVHKVCTGFVIDLDLLQIKPDMPI